MALNIPVAGEASNNFNRQVIQNQTAKHTQDTSGELYRKVKQGKNTKKDSKHIQHPTIWIFT